MMVTMMKIFVLHYKKGIQLLWSYEKIPLYVAFCFQPSLVMFPDNIFNYCQVSWQVTL